MNTKVDLKSNELVSIFHEKTEWNLARVKFLVYFICALFKVQTVCFTTIAEALNGDAQVESNLRRIQRFFAEFVIEMDLFAKIVFSLLPIQAPFRLSMDRTNWKFGGLDINILMISVCYLGVAIPLIWMMLPKKGNSNQKERKALIEHYIRLFGTQSIGSILADREFIGDDWIGDLIGKRVHFYFRIKENMKVKINGKEPQKALWLFNNLPKNTAMSLRKIVKVGTQYVYLSGMKTIDKDGKLTFVIIATYNFDPEALTVYKDRWQIETMFKALKTSGFNIEDTHLTDIERISKLLCLVVIAFIWAYLAGIYKHKNIKPIKIKNHGRMEYSFFRYGLIFIAHILLCSILHRMDTIIRILIPGQLPVRDRDNNILTRSNQKNVMY